MSNLERAYYEIDGANALKRRAYPIRPELRLVTSSSEEESTSSANVISFTEFKLKKDQELFAQRLKLMPSVLTLRNLRREVIEITSTPQTESESLKAEAKPNSEKAANVGPDLLKGTGFTPLEEMSSIKTKYNEGLAKGEDLKQLINRIVTENLTNIRWYQWEYTMSDPVLPNPVALSEKGELVNSKSGYSVVEMTNEEEREGAVKLSVIRAQELLNGANEGDTVVIPSPPKWNGRKDAKEYPEAEWFVFRKGKGRHIRALTFIAELTLEQCQEISDYFVKPDPSAESKELTEKERIIKMVSNPLLIKGGKARFEDILERIQIVKGGDIMREANGANRTFAEAWDFLKRGDELQKLPDLCEEIILTYEKYLRENIENINDPTVYAAINQRMQLTVLEIAKTLKGDQKADSPNEVSFFYKQAMASTNVIDPKIMQSNYNQQIAYLRTRPGCNGGGAEATNVFGSNLKQILGGYSGISGGGSAIGGESSPFTEKCSTCKLELCEGRCPNCEKNKQKEEAKPEKEEYSLPKAA